MTDEPGALDRAFQLERDGDARFTLHVADGWQQGRGAFGGLVLGALLRAVEACEPDPARRLRSLTGEIVAPVLVGEAHIAVEPVRLGSGVSTWSATLRQDGETRAQVSAVLGRTRPVDHRWAPAPPAMAAWRDVPSFPVAGPGPTFAQYFEYRNSGPLPFSSAAEPAAEGFIRPRGRVTWDAATVVATADAWWPASLAIESAPRPTATVAFTLQLFAPDPPAAPDAPLFHRARAVAAEEGFQMESRELWTPQGGLVALNQQTFVWIK